jgi:hypothetical protein
VKSVQLLNVEGGWLTLTSLAIEADGHTSKLNLVDSGGLRQSGEIAFEPARGSAALRTTSNLDRAWLRDTCYSPWRDAHRAGLGVMIGEMGAFQHTPHAVVLRWMEDVLATAQEADFGWALWNFRGGFGVLDSNRSDVTYGVARPRARPCDAEAVAEILSRFAEMVFRGPGLGCTW